MKEYGLSIQSFFSDMNVDGTIENPLITVAGSEPNRSLILFMSDWITLSFLERSFLVDLVRVTLAGERFLRDELGWVGVVG